MPTVQTYTDEELVSLLREGSAEAFEELFNRHWLVVHRRFYKKLQSQTLAEEYTQELFIRLWERRSELVIRTSLAHYLNGAVRNMVVNNIRSEIKKKLLLENAHHAVISSSDADDQLINNLYTALKDLPEKTGDIIRLSKLEGLSVKEIASQHNISSKAVEYHITKALKMLKTYFKNLKNAAALLMIVLKLF